MVHAALNLVTGEVLTSTRSNTLKRRIKHNTAWDVAHGYGYSEWVFAHGDDWQNILAEKAAAHGCVA